MNILYKHIYSIKSALRRKIISNDYASFTVKNIGTMLLVIDLAECILKDHLEEPKYLCM